MAQLKAGMRLRSAVSEVELIVIKADAASTPTCGGAPMLAGSEPPAAAAAAADDAQIQLGKRYVNASGSVEVVCVKAGKGSLAVDGDPMQVKAAKALPSSD